MRRVDYIIRFVRDLDRSVAFYRDVVGVPVKLHGDGYVEFATENVKFALYDRSKLTELIGTKPSELSAAQGEVVFLVEDVDSQAERLRQAGVGIASGPIDRSWGHRTVHVIDPDGFIVEFAQEIRRRRSH